MKQRAFCQSSLVPGDLQAPTCHRSSGEEELPGGDCCLSSRCGCLEDERVAVIAGSSFGDLGEGHVRMCYATAYEQIEEALIRIRRFVQRYRAS